MLVVGLASVIIGETIFGRHNVMIGLISVIVGSVIYRLIISVVLRYDILPVYMFKLVSAVVVAVALSIPAIKENINKARLIHKGRSNSNVRNN
jgi:putative ABC transport system permease protein